MKRIHFLTVLMMTSCSVMERTASPPNFDVTLPEEANHQVEHKKYKEGDSLDAFFFNWKAASPQHVLSGQWNASNFENYESKGSYYGGSQHRWWKITIQRGVSEKLKKAVLHAQNGYEAELSHRPSASARIYPRFERKSFSWGKGVSFLVQYQNCNEDLSPNNGMLEYEVHGFTSDGLFTVVASCGVTHPDLPSVNDIHKVRGYRYNGTTAADTRWPLRQDPDYKLVESCAADAFEPSLASVDRLADSLRNIR
jgi:hypothetical protein